MAIVQALREIQTRYGYLPERELELLALKMQLRLSRVQEVASFFPFFRSERSLIDPDTRQRREPPQVCVHICRDMACHLRGSPRLVEAVEKEFAEHVKTGTIEVKAVSCLGRCDQAAAACLQRRQPVAHEKAGDHGVICGGLQGTAAKRLCDMVRAQLQPCADAVAPKAEALPGKAEGPTGWKIDIYNPVVGERPQPFAAVDRFLREQIGEGVIDLLNKASLLGMGGALGRGGRKWADVRDKVHEGWQAGRTLNSFVVCNADESEPGTFKDRELLRRTPELVAEGVLIAGLCLKASKGYVFIRHEYGEQIRAVQGAIDRLKAWLRTTGAGEKVCGFPMEVFVSGGGYICGEQSALLEAIEGRRAQPRNPIPSIAANGLFDQPTLVNNVETLAWVPGIVLNGPEWYGKDARRFFSISGDVQMPGVYELPIAGKLRDLFEKAGGMRPGLAFEAIATSGPSGGFLPARFAGDGLRSLRERARITLRDLKSAEAVAAAAGQKSRGTSGRLARFVDEQLGDERPFVDVLELGLDGTFWRDLGLNLGAGMVVYGKEHGKPSRMPENALNCLEFFERESCGKCVPCRLGCQKLVDLAHSLSPVSRPTVQATADGLAELMQITSICSLGRSASNPLTSYLKYF